MGEEGQGFEAELSADLRRGEVCAGEGCRGGFAVVGWVDVADGEGSFVREGEVEDGGAELGREVEVGGHGWLFGGECAG